MNFVSARCNIRPFQADEIDRFMVYRNDAEWMKYQGFKGLTKEAYEEALLGVLSLEKGMQLAIVNKLTQVLMGDVYLRKESDVLWIGYTITPVYARRGYAFEAIAAIINQVRTQRYSAIKAGVEAKNIRSINLLKKIGFHLTYIEDNEQIFVLDLNTQK